MERCSAPWCSRTFKPNGTQRFCRNRECQSRRLRERLVPDFGPGDDVLALTAFGYWLEKRAVSGFESGGAFPVVFLAWRDDDGDEDGVPWPLDGLRWPWEDVDGEVFSHDQYRLRVGLGPTVAA